MVRTNCAVSGCYATSKNNKDLKFHRFPQDERAQSWIAACQRPDLRDKSPKQLYNMHVCSLHFEKWMYMNKKLKDAALPSLNLPNTQAMEAIGGGIQIEENSVTGRIKTEKTSPPSTPEPSTAKALPKPVRNKRTIFRHTSEKTKEVVFNIHQYYLNRKWDPKNWEYDVDLNINRHVAKVTGLSQGMVQKIIREIRDASYNSKKTTEQIHFKEPQVQANVLSESTTSNQAPSTSDDTEPDIPDVPLTVKVEVDEEDLSAHEDDIMEKLEIKRRMQEEDPLNVNAKKVRVELVPIAETPLEQSQYEVIVQPQQSQVPFQSQHEHSTPMPLQQQWKSSATRAEQMPNASDTALVSEFFMKIVMQNQNEILSILKRQVLLQDPDPELLTFLRYLGSKLLRLPKERRDELQDKITEMVYEYKE